jgi:sugar/nucleoside kinase (ribokinase family)
VLQRAQAAGFKTSVDVVSVESDRFADIVLPALRFCDYCILNELEAERTTGVTIIKEGIVDLSAARVAARQLVDAGVREWVVIHFPYGAIAVNGQNNQLVQPSVNMPQASIGGTTGAGDAFAAGILLGLHENAPMKTALRYGVCTAAASLTDPSSSDGVVPLRECLALAEKHGYRDLG